MKILVTHINPHLDDVTAVWLFRTLHPDFKAAKVDFISASKDAALKNQDPDKLYLGTGGGDFDEHKGDLEDCATSLSWKYLKKNGFTPKDTVAVAALNELVEWARLIDLAKMPEQQYDDFSVQAFIRSTDNTPEGSLETTELANKILDRILEVLIKKHRSIGDWKGRVEFQTKFGDSFAVKSEYIGRKFCYDQGGDLFLIFNPKNSDIQFCTHNREVDLEPLYKILVKVDPKSSWFLHQSHQMVICGSGSAPESIRTKLSLEELINIAKSV